MTPDAFAFLRPAVLLQEVAGALVSAALTLGVLWLLAQSDTNPPREVSEAANRTRVVLSGGGR